MSHRAQRCKWKKSPRPLPRVWRPPVGKTCRYRMPIVRTQTNLWSHLASSCWTNMWSVTTLTNIDCFCHHLLKDCFTLFIPRLCVDVFSFTFDCGPFWLLNNINILSTVCVPFSSYLFDFITCTYFMVAHVVCTIVMQNVFRLFLRKIKSYYYYPSLCRQLPRLFRKVHLPKSVNSLFQINWLAIFAVNFSILEAT